MSCNIYLKPPFLIPFVKFMSTFLSSSVESQDDLVLDLETVKDNTFPLYIVSRFSSDL